MFSKNYYLKTIIAVTSKQWWPTSSMKDLQIIDELSKIIGKEIIEEEDHPAEREVYFTSSGEAVVALSLKGLNLDKLPTFSSQLKNLVLLNLQENNFSEFPVEIRQLTNLVVLNLSFNQIKALPSWVIYLYNLRTLELNNNQLYALPDFISELTLLRKIYLQSNKIHSLPFNLSELKLLEELHLDFRATMKKSTRAILNVLEANGCRVFSDYNRR